MLGAALVLLNYAYTDSEMLALLKAVGKLWRDGQA